LSTYNKSVVWSFTASVAIVGSNTLALGPIAPDIANHWQTDLNHILRASASFGVGTAVSAFFLARYIDRTGVKAALCSALLVLTLAFAASAITVSAWQLVLVQFVAGLASGIALPACYAGAAIIAPPGQASRILGVVLTGWTISLVLGVTLSTLIADNIHWRAVYAILALLAASVTLYNMIAKLPGKPPPQNSISMLSAFVIKGVPTLLLQVACYMTAFYGVYNLIGDHIVSSLHYPLSTNALVALSYGIGFGLATWFDPVIDSLLPSRDSEENPQQSVTFQRPTINAAALSGLALLYIALALSSENLVTLIAATGMWGLLNHVGLNVLINSLNASSSTYRGAVLGLYSGITYVCMSAGTILFSSLYAWGDFTLLCMFASGLCLFASAVSLFTRVK